MAAGQLPSPGTEFGPCEKPLCGHEDCRVTRNMAALSCRVCSMAIGYDRRFYSEDPGPESQGTFRQVLVHAVCLEREVLHEQVARLEAQAEMASEDRDPARAEMLGEEAHAGRKLIADQEGEGGCENGL